MLNRHAADSGRDALSDLLAVERLLNTAWSLQPLPLTRPG
jgi:hypothetical protein